MPNSETTLLDSLRIALSMEKDPLRKIDLHLGYCRAAIFYGDFNLGTPHLDTAVQLSRRRKYHAGEVKALLMQITCLEERYDTAYHALEEQAVRVADESQKPALKRAVEFTELANLLEAGDLENSRKFLEELLQKYPSVTVGQQAGAQYARAELHFIEGSDSLAISAYLEALKLYDQMDKAPPVVPELGRPSVLHTTLRGMNQAKIRVEIARIYTDQGHFDAAIAAYDKAEAAFAGANAKSFVGWVLADKGEAYAIKGDIETAVALSLEAVSIFEELNASSDLADIYHGLSGLYAQQEDLKATEAFLEKSLEIAEDQFSYNLLFDLYVDFSALHKKRGDEDKALKYLEMGADVARRSNDVNLIGPGLLNLAEGLQATGKYEMAMPSLRQARTLATKLNDNDVLFQAHGMLQQGFQALGMLDSARYFLNLSRDNANTSADIRQQQAVALLASRLAEREGNFEGALAEWKNYHAYSRQVFSGEAQGKLKAEEVRQNVREINEEKNLALREATLLNRQNQLYLLLLFALLALLAAGTWFFVQLRRNKRQIEAQKNQLEQLNATKDKFFGIIAHDIRSPIVALDGVGEQMSWYLEKGKTDKLERLAGRVDQTAKRLNGLLDNLLNWALLQQGVIPYHPRGIDVDAVGREVLAMFRSHADGKDVRLESNIAPGQQVYADEAALQTILRNLVSNAVKFTPAGGMVTLGAETLGDKVFLTVNDTGTGISAENIRRIFTLEKVSTKGTAGEKGTGLGLTLVKELAELNKGSLAVSSEPLRGSEFRVGLPLAA